MRRNLAIGGLGLLSVVGAAGWLRKPQPVAAFVPDSAISQFQTAPASTPLMYHQPRAAVRTARVAPRRVVRESSPVVVEQRRSKKTSAAIIAGSAGAGAAIGALAGGGKGAAIGVISGGAAGLIFDRMTHKRTEVVR